MLVQAQQASPAGSHTSLVAVAVSLRTIGAMSAEATRDPLDLDEDDLRKLAAAGVVRDDWTGSGHNLPHAGSARTRGLARILLISLGAALAVPLLSVLVLALAR